LAIFQQPAISADGEYLLDDLRPLSRFKIFDHCHQSISRSPSDDREALFVRSKRIVFGCPTFQTGDPLLRQDIPWPRIRRLVMDNSLQQNRRQYELGPCRWLDEFVCLHIGKRAPRSAPERGPELPFCKRPAFPRSIRQYACEGKS